jgi:hypothetical protein
MAFHADDLINIRDLVIEGLMTDGAHHKQYYLEAILGVILDHEEFEETKKEFEWEPGIPG